MIQGYALMFGLYVFSISGMDIVFEVRKDDPRLFLAFI